MQTNTRPAPAERTYEGGPAVPADAIGQLRRTVLACLLWEASFYEGGVAVAERIKALVPRCRAADVAALAVQARTAYKIRHASLLLARELARHPDVPDRSVIGDTIAAVVDRADELAEFLSLYWQEDPDAPLSKQVKRGLAAAFAKFDAYQLGKYARDKAVKLRDVAFLCHPKPTGVEQADVWARLVNRDRYPAKYGSADRPFEPLASPDTWEVQLSGGADKRATFERLIAERKLGAMALLRNLRNMQSAGVPVDVLREALATARVERVLPYRFVTAARYAPALEPELEAAMFRSVEGLPKLAGRTVLLVDVSGSMDGRIAGQSEVLRVDAAAGLAVLARELCEDVRVFTFSNDTVEVPARRGFALRDAIKASQPHGGTALGASVAAVATVPQDRLIVFTDEQSSDPVGPPPAAGYMVNVATYEHGVGFGDWTRVSGFSEATLAFVRAVEDERAAAEAAVV